MEMLKNAIFTACLCAILSSAVQMLSAERMKKEIRFVCGLVMIVCTAAQLSGMKLSLSETDFLESYEYERMKTEFSESVTAQTAESLEESLKAQLEDETGLSGLVKKISIDCTLDEYNSVSAQTACIYLDEGATAENVRDVMSAAEKLLPETEIYVKT
jgi:hypothetical protein